MSRTADLILENARVITCDPAYPDTEAVAVKGDRILQVGANYDISQLKGPNTRSIDCGGKVLVPGFNDAHCHFNSLVRKLFSLDMSPAQVHSIADIQNAIRRKAKYTRPGVWISGTDYNEFYLVEKRHPTRDDLDKVSPHHPVILTHRSLHASVLNSTALRRVGINNRTEEPEGGIIDRDLETGDVNGILYEMQDYLHSRIKSPISGPEREWGIEQANRQYLSCGITSIGEATVTNDMAQWNFFKKILYSRQLRPRVNMMPGYPYLDTFRDGGLVTGAGNKALRVGGLKIVISFAAGRLNPSLEELEGIVVRADRAGFQLAIHAVEKEAVEAAVTALEKTRGMNPEFERRHRIEHCSECPQNLRERLRRLQAVIVSQPPFIYYHGDRYLSQVDAETRRWLYPFKSWGESGLLVAGSSDSPVVPNNPLMGMYAAVTRRSETGQPLLPEESVTPQQALEMYTINAAFTAFEERIKGSLTPGKLADIVMLNVDPLRSPPEALKEGCVEMTVIGGEVVWERGSQDSG
jgi:predicted amidohydrolase YtcJ